MAALYNEAGLRCIYKDHRRAAMVHAIAWSPDGTAIASASAYSGFLPGGRIRSGSFRISPIEKVRPMPRVRERGEHIDDRVHVWHPMTGKKITMYSRHDNTVRSIDFSPTGRQVVTACNDGTAHIWNLAAVKSTQLTYDDHLHGHLVDEFARRAGMIHVYSARWSPDGRKIASVGGRDVRVWAADTGRTTMTTKWDNQFAERTIGWSPDGRYIAFSQYHAVEIFDAFSGRKAAQIIGSRFYAFAWSPRSMEIACAGEIVQVRDALTGRLIREYGKNLGGPIQAVSWSRDGAFLAAGGPDNAVRVWDVSSTRQVCVYDLHDGWVRDLAWSPDGRHIASGGADSEVHVWQTGI